MVVDDMLDIAEPLAELLRLKGYRVWTSLDATSALQLAEEVEPHCILFDVVMPGIGGDGLCRSLRNLYGDDIVLIAVSGYERTDPRVANTFTLADHYFVKPLDLALLDKVLPPVS
jgi:DNA-binding response OmpR family regulator